MEGIIIFFVIASIVSAIANAAKRAQQNGGNTGGRSASVMNAASRPGAYTGSATSEQRARLEQLRRLQQQRQAAVGASDSRPASPYAEKPVIPHSNEDCGGGSIHDGYHEGAVRRPAPASSAEGRLGRQGVMAREGLGASELYKKDLNERKAEKASNIPPLKQPIPVSAEAVPEDKKEPSGAERLASAISDKPAIVQGLIWNEVLGRPLSHGR